MMMIGDWWLSGAGAVVRSSMLIGDLTASVEVCMQSGKFAEALILASTGGDDLWTKTKNAYLKKLNDPFFK
jgi:protein transport protein SEC31